MPTIKKEFAPWDPIAYFSSMTIGERIKAARKKAGFTQKQLAEKVGVDYSHIGKWERNQHRPMADTIEAIVSALGISMAAFYGETRAYWDRSETLRAERPGRVREDRAPYGVDSELDEWWQLYGRYRKLPPGLRRKIRDLIDEACAVASGSGEATDENR